MEVWKDIKGYEGLYQVSNLGRVRSLDKVEYIGNKAGGITCRQQGESLRLLANEFGVSESRVYMIACGKSWGWLK